MDDDIVRLDAELQALIAHTRDHGERRVRILSGMRNFLTWMRECDAEIERIAGQFAPPERQPLRADPAPFDADGDLAEAIAQQRGRR